MSRREVFASCTVAPAAVVAAAVPALAAGLGPVTLNLLEAYKTWLDFEQRWLLWQMADDPQVLECYAGALDGLAGVEHRMDRARKLGGYLAFIGDSGDASPDAYGRAALVLEAAGCDWREGDVQAPHLVIESPALIVKHPDATLLALREPWERALAATEVIAPLHARAEERYLAARAAHPEKTDRVLRKESGLTLVDRRWGRVIGAYMAASKRIAECPARTLDGLTFKAQVCRKRDFDPDLARSLVADLVSMAPA